MWVNTYLKSDKENIFFPPALHKEILWVEKCLAIQFPEDYKHFLLLSNGFEGWIGPFYAQLEPIEKILEETDQWCKEFHPWAIFLGSNGNLEMLVLDTRPQRFQFGLLPNIGDESDFIALGQTFQECIQRLYNGTAFG